MSGNVLYIGKPALMIVNRINRQADDLYIAFGEFMLKPGQRAKLGCTDGREILGMRKQYPSAGAQPFVKTDFAAGGLRGEVRRDIIDAKRHYFLLLYYLLPVSSPACIISCGGDDLICCGWLSCADRQSLAGREPVCRSHSLEQRKLTPKEVSCFASLPRLAAITQIHS
jgi:hypothetical protein